MVIVIAPGFDGYTVVGLETGQTELKTAAFGRYTRRARKPTWHRTLSACIGSKSCAIEGFRGIKGTGSSKALNPLRRMIREFLMSEGSLLIDCFCFEIRDIAFRHGKPQDDLPADFVLGACQSDVAQLNYV
jgi:hypothetical protein